MNLNKKILPYLFAVIFASLDLITKYFIRINNIQEQVIIDNFLTIDLTYNTGIAFGLFSEYTLITYVFSIFVFTWLIFQFREVKNGTVEFYSLTLILAGAIELNPNLFNSYFLLGSILIGQKKLQEAEQPQIGRAHV